MLTFHEICVHIKYLGHTLPHLTLSQQGTTFSFLCVLQYVFMWIKA